MQCPPQAWAHLGRLAGANLCRDAQGLQDALWQGVVTRGLLDKVQQHFITTCSRWGRGWSGQGAPVQPPPHLVTEMRELLWPHPAQLRGHRELGHTAKRETVINKPEGGREGGRVRAESSSARPSHLSMWPRDPHPMTTH